MAISSPLLETSIHGARGVLINVTGSMDIGLEEVEQAASLVQEAVHPDALTIFGAAFDETLDDEIRVTVIATGFDGLGSSNYYPTAAAAVAAAQEAPAAAAPEAPAVGPISFEEDKAAEEAAKKAAEEAAAAEAKKEEIDDDPFDEIFKIFSRK